jgi:superfamily I DNA and RNA helicase
MALEVQLSRRAADDAAAVQLIETLTEASADLGLSEALLYYGFPRFRDEDDSLVSARVLLMSPQHGVHIFGTVSTSGRSTEELVGAAEATESVLSLVYAKLLGNKALRHDPRTLSFPVEAYLYAPFLEDDVPVTGDLECLTSPAQLRDKLREKEAVPSEIYAQLVATLDGSRSIPRPKKRELGELGANAKGRLVAQLESELAKFDSKQREGATTVITGPQRIRGLAGSGKTIVLSRKAALTHLEHPDANIAYTFHTKSLYQQIRRLITRFYRAEHDRDPDWNQIQVLHSWGGSSDAGIYSRACEFHGVRAVSFSEAKANDATSPFGYACRELLAATQIKPMYDYLFIDEGQDFPPEFVQLCARLTTDMRFVYAYDDLQSIFQTQAPDAAAIFGRDKAGEPRNDFERDIVLYKCYRNPLEILVCAHAIGFGVYGAPVQMLENEEHWSDVGYRVTGGPLVAGRQVEILRPPENSLPALSSRQSIDELVDVACFNSFDEEIENVATAILAEIADGLRPDDIVVTVVDDRNARSYLKALTRRLDQDGIACNNIHEAYGVPEFQVDGRVTLTTVHKAKGNEGFAVHVVGADAVFETPSKAHRNRLFTAMTRTKGWLRVTGVGNAARRLADEIAQAKANCPYLRFEYPSELALETMKRDLSTEDAITMDHERMLDSLTEDQLQAYLARRRKPTKGRK